MPTQPSEPVPQRGLRLRLAAAAEFFAFARPENWLVSKIPPLLAVAYLQGLRLGLAPHDIARLIALSLFSIFCVAIYGHVVNDIFDQEADRLANKVNRLATMQPGWRLLLPWVFLIAGFLPALIGNYSPGVLSLLMINYLWPTIYSIPVIRLKEKGLFGVACDALGSHITPTLFILVLFATSAAARPSAGQTGFAFVTTLWAAVLGLKGILHHQIADRSNDKQSGVVTFATRTSMEGLQRFLTGFNLLVELPVSAVYTALVYISCPLAIVAFVIYTASEAMKYHLGFQFALTADPATIRASVPFTNEMFYVLWLPIAAATQLALYNPALSWLPLLQLVIFYPLARQQVSDWRAVSKSAALVYSGRRTRQVH